jgi:adenylate cyclase
MHTHLPQDRLRALARGEPLPDRTTGAALFADISGFTPLTEALRDSLGPRRGAEELTKHLDAVYTALIAEVECYGGSVISFAGDAITCWFDDAHGPAAPRAITCAFALQQAMRAFTSIALQNGTTTALALKVAVASGAARRFVVGDPTMHYLDALAGATVARTSTAEHLAQRGDVLLDEATVTRVGAAISIREWRTDHDSNERFAVVEPGLGVGEHGSENPNSRLPTPEVPIEQLRDWLHKAQVEREHSFLTEFRPCAVLFVRFVGIDYEADDAQAQLDAFIRQLQGITARYEGAVLQLTIGDKGSYIYINFGALSSHEDDTRRAVKTALELRKKTALHVQMGLTHGVMRVGAYGGATRRTYGALGDEVNLAARLMSTAAVGEILLSGHVQKATANDVVFEPRSPLPMKGKAEPLPVFAVTGERQQRAIRLQEPTYALPMVGRVQELGIINDKLELALSAKGQIIGIVAEAGIGKSRLVAELIRSARKKGFVGYGGACQSDGINTLYLTWKSIWQAVFDTDPNAPLKKQIRSLEGEVEDKAPERAQALPLLGIVLDLDIPDNEFTKTLEPQYRQSVLRALLEDCLRAAAKDEPTLIVIEDMHWIDALSHDLLEELARALSDSRVCFLLAYRPPQLARLETPRLEAMPNFTKIPLHELNAAEAESAIRAKLAQLYPARGGALPVGLVDKLMARSQGNPFYLEELLNYVRDRGLDPANLDKIELPDSLHTLILSRIDILTESEKSTLRVASIVGRLFRADWLMGYYPKLGELPRIKNDLEQLATMEITPLDTPEPELAYLFKHIVTHEVTYESLPFATRAQLHEQLAKYLESIAAPVDMIAQHYGRSHNHAKQREYWQKAGDAAHAAFANETVLDYYERLRPLLSEPRELGELHLRCAEAYGRLGRLVESRQQVTLALSFLGQSLPTTTWQVRSRLLGQMMRQAWHRLWFAQRPVIADSGQAIPEISADILAVVRAYDLLTLLDLLAGQVSIVDFYYSLRILNLYESAQSKSPGVAYAYAKMGHVVGVIPIHALARHYFRRAREAMEGLDNPSELAWVAFFGAQYEIGIGKWLEVERACRQAHEIFDRFGDRRNWVFTMAYLANSAFFQGQFARCFDLGTELYQAELASHHIEHQAWGLHHQARSYLRQRRASLAAAVLEQVFPLLAVIPNSRLTVLDYCGQSAIIHLQQGQLEQARQSVATCEQLLAQNLIPSALSFESYAQVAEVYLALWEKEASQASHAKPQMQLLAKQACRALHRFARTYPIAKPRAWLWQGLYDWLDGKPGRARRAWQKSLAAAQKLAMPYDEALAHYEIGWHATADEQKSNLARANEIFDQLGIIGFGVQSSRMEE